MSSALTTIVSVTVPPDASVTLPVTAVPANPLTEADPFAAVLTLCAVRFAGIVSAKVAVNVLGQHDDR